MRLRIIGGSLALLLSVALPGCGWADSREDKMYALASALPGVADAVAASVRFGMVADGVDGPALVEEANTRNPSRLDPFKDYYLTARRVGQRTSVLVCDADRSQGLLEDTNCGSGVEEHLWRDRQNAPCAFVIDLVAVCSR